jgi:hypothetical protein
MLGIKMVMVCPSFCTPKKNGNGLPIFNFKEEYFSYLFSLFSEPGSIVVIVSHNYT